MGAGSGGAELFRRCAFASGFRAFVVRLLEPFGGSVGGGMDRAQASAHLASSAWCTHCGSASTLGIIGWASPLTSAGILFPRTGWFGLIVTAVLPGLLVVRPRIVWLSAAAFIMLSNLMFNALPAVPAGWEAVDTHFGDTAHRLRSPAAEFAAAESIQERAMASTARVIIFPETVVPVWTEATDIFWQQTLAAMRANGKTIVLGAGRPATARGDRPVDYSRELAILGNDRVPPLPEQRRVASSSSESPFRWACGSRSLIPASR